MAIDLTDQDTRDYLGNPSALSLADKPGVPTSGLPAAAGAPSTAPAGTGGSSAPSPGRSLRRASSSGAPVSTSGAPVSTSGVAATSPEGGTAEPGALRAPSLENAAGGDGGNIMAMISDIVSAGGKAADVIDAIIEMAQSGRGGSDLKLSGVFDEGDGVISSGDFSLNGKEGSEALQGLTLGAGSLNDILPELLRLRGVFDEGGTTAQAVSSVPGVNLSGAEESGSALTGTAAPKFDLNATDPSALDQALGSITDNAGPILNFALGIASLFAGGTPTSDQLAQFIGQTITSPTLYTTLNSLFPSLFEGAAGAATGAGAAGAAGAGAGGAGGAAAGGAGGLAAGAAGAVPGLIIAAFSASQQITRAFGPDLKRRAERTADAMGLQGEILAPIFNARTPEEFASALATDVGGSTAGDALASILKNNLQGTYYTDTDHAWAPDLSYVPMLQALERLGYGKSEPTRRDVGGVGEIIAGAGQRLINPKMYEQGGRLYPGVISDEGGTLTGGNDPGGFYGTAAGGALGYEGVLRTLAGVPDDAPSMVRPTVLSQGGVRDTSSEGGGFINPETGERVSMQQGLDPEYLAALREYSPDVARRVEESAETALQTQLRNPAYVGYSP